MNDDNKGKHDWAKLISVVIAVLTLLLGNNLYQQWTGHSFFGDIRPKTQPTATPRAYADT